MQIRLTIWRKEIVEKYSTLMDYTEQCAARVKINREAKMADLSEMIKVKYGVAEPVIMKRTPMLQNQAVEIISDSSKHQKGLNELRVNEGVNLYVEDAADRLPEAKEGNSTNWEVEFELEINRF